VPKALRETETTQAIEAIGKLSKFGWISKRDVAIMLLLYGCGLRISEALSLRWCDLPAACSDDIATLTITGSASRQSCRPSWMPSRTIARPVRSSTIPMAPCFEDSKGGG